jgi:hypothetical protein
MKLKNGLFTAIIYTITGASFAQNPIIQTHYSPDPAQWFIKGKYMFTPVIIYLAFKGQNITAGRVLFNFDHWVFKKPD